MVDITWNIDLEKQYNNVPKLLYKHNIAVEWSQYKINSHYHSLYIYHQDIGHPQPSRRNMQVETSWSMLLSLKLFS